MIVGGGNPIIVGIGGPSIPGPPIGGGGRGGGYFPPGARTGITIGGGGGIIGGGITTPIGPINYAVCGPNSDCSGPSLDLPGGISACLGACVPRGNLPPLPPPNGGDPIVDPTLPPDGGVGGGGGTGTCDAPTRAYCESLCGTAGNGSIGGGCGGSGCCTASGKKGRLNKSGYYLKNGTYVAPGTKCVSPRRMNYGNGRALNRAIRRAKGFDRMVKRNRKALRSLARI